MATAVEPARRQEAAVERRLAEVTGRTRFVDAAAGAAGLACAVMGYGLSMILLDRWLVLDAAVRQLALVAFLAAWAGLAYLAVVRPLRRPINPRYAAWLAEQAVGDRTNSLINWVDLRDDPLPPAIRTSVTGRAARQLDGADLGPAVPTRRLAVLGIAAAALVLAGIVTLAVLRPTQFFSLLARTFSPFERSAIANQTQLTLLEPADGDTTLAVHTPLTVAVRAEGRVPKPTQPDALKVRFRYRPDDPTWDERPLDEGVSAGEWVARLPAAVVRNGLYYHVTGGDARLPADGEYRVQVRSNPLVTGYEVTYTYRPYLRWEPQTTTDPIIEGFRGTQVTVLARTNRTVRDGRLVFDGGDTLAGERVDGRPEAVRFRFTLEKDARYRVFFTGTDGDANSAPVAYPVKVLTDQPPAVELRAPKDEEVELPPDGTLTVDALASDDFGVESATLRLQVKGPKEGAPSALKPIPYREGKSFRREDGTWPKTLETKEVLALDRLRDPQNFPVPLEEGAVITYWVEATDNCDYPSANVGRSRVGRIKVTAARPKKDEDGKKADQQKRDAANAAKKDHEQKQDKKHQNEDRQAQPPERNGQQQGESRKKDGGQGQKQENQPGEPKPGEKRPEDGQKGEGQPEKKPGENGEGKPNDKPDQQPGQNQPQPKGGEKNDQPNGQAGENHPKNDGPKGDNRPQPDGKAGDKQDQSEPNQKGDKPAGGGTGEKSGQPRKGDSGQGGQPKGEAGTGDDAPQSPEEKKLQEQVRRANEALRRKEQGGKAGDGQKSEGQPQDQKPDGSQQPGQGEPKAGDDRKPDGSRQQPGKDGGDRKQPGDQKAGGQKGEQGGRPEGKPGEKSDGPQSGQPQGGNDARPERMPEKKGESKEPGQAGEQKPGEQPAGAGKSEAGGKGDKQAEQKHEAGKSDGDKKAGDGSPQPGGANGQRPDEKKPNEQATKPGDKTETTPGKQGQPGEKDKGQGQGGNPQPAEAGKPQPKPGEKGPAGDDRGDKKNGQETNDKAAGKQPQEGEAKQGGTPDGRGEKKDRDGPTGKEPTGKGEATQTKPEGEKGASRPDRPKPDGQGKGMDKPDPNAGPAEKNEPGKPPEGQNPQGSGAKKPDERGDGRGEKTGDQPGSADEKAAREAAEQLAKDLRSNDPATREAARKKLDDLAEKAKDPKVREALKDAMKKAGEQKGDGQGPDGKQPKDGDKAEGESPEGGKDGKPDERRRKADDRGEMPDQPGGKAGERAERSPKEDGRPDKQPAKREGTGAPSQTPGDRPASGAPGDEPPLEKAAPNKDNLDRATDLQLDKLRKNRDDLMKELKMSPEEYDRFLKSYEAMAKKQAARRDPAGKGDVVGGDRTGRSGVNAAGPRRLQPGGEQAGPTEQGPVGVAPPGFRDAQRQFSEELSKRQK